MQIQIPVDFLFSKDILTFFCSAGDLTMNFLNFCLTKRAFISPLFLNDNIIEFWKGNFFLSSLYSFLLFSCLRGFRQKVHYNSYPCSSTGKVFSLTLASLKIPGFQQFEYDMHSRRGFIFCFYSAWYSLSFLDLRFVVCL